MSKRLTIPKFKSLINKGMKPNDVLEKVFKKYKGTIHDTLYWKNKIKSHINNYCKSKSSRRRSSKSLKKSKRRRSSKSLKKSKRRFKKDGNEFPTLSYYSATVPMFLYK